jgi:hypothetical protein
MGVCDSHHEIPATLCKVHVHDVAHKIFNDLLKKETKYFLSGTKIQHQV